MIVIDIHEAKYRSSSICSESLFWMLLLRMVVGGARGEQGGCWYSSRMDTSSGCAVNCAKCSW